MADKSPKQRFSLPFEIELTVLDFFLSGYLSRILKAIHSSEKRIMATQAELAASLVALKDQNEKAAAEQAAALQAVKDALAAAGNTTPAVDAALADLAASIQREDDLNPDAPAPAP